MDNTLVLHILRNPHGWVEEQIRAARLTAADLIEAQAAILDERNDMIESQAKEITRLRDTTDGTTHSDACWSWGPKHYECAVRRVKELQKKPTYSTLPLNAT